MPAARIAGLLFLLLTAGCAGIGCAPPHEPPQTGATQGGAATAEPPQAGAPQKAATAVKPPPSTAVTQGEAVAVRPEARPATPSTTGPTGESVAKNDAPGAKTPAKVPATAAPKEPLPKKESAAPAPAKPAAPPSLDLTSLEKQLRETDAIGVMTKLTLKNQVDDLLNRFRAYYEGRIKTTLAQLRQPYDTLILKVISLLQDKDPSLASAIAASREAIWGILSDPAKFSKL